ncbi:unnamed protein product, partial [Meganyctiphanes norvegica]
MCPGDYLAIAGEYFHFSEDTLSWEEAQAACKGCGDKLAVPRYIDVFLSETVKKQLNGDFFVGGRKDTHGIWKGTNGNPLHQYWINGKPLDGEHIDCLGIRLHVQKYFNQKCSIITNKYICQKSTENFDITIYVVCFIIFFIVLLAVVIGIYTYKKRKQSQSKVLDSTTITNPSFGSQPTRHDSENSLYGQTLPTEVKLSGRHDSENSLYGQSVPMGEIRISGRHDSENSIYGKL